MSPSADEHAEQEQKEEEKEDGSWVNEELLREILEDGATVLDIDIQRATGKGDNYLSVLYRTRLQYRTPQSQEPQILGLIVKGIPPGEFMQNYIEEIGVFRREIAIYVDMLPRLYSFADAKLGKDRFKRFSAEFYKCSRPDTLILQDLKPEGFVMASRRDRLDLAHSKLVVQNLARFHALSVAYNEQNRGNFSQYPDTVFCVSNRERLNQFFPAMVKSVIEEMRKWEGCSRIADKLEAMQDTFLDKLIDICRVESSHRTVLIHGDSWVNNILFKYSETGQPVDLRFVDYQISREASPAMDLNYFLFTSPRTDVRARHFDNLLQEYCDMFESSAKELGYGGEPITFEEIKREMDRTAVFGFMAAMSIMPIVLAAPEDTLDLETLTEDNMQSGETDIYGKIHAMPAFREALEATLSYFEERGVLD